MKSVTTAKLSFREAARTGKWIQWGCYHSADSDMFSLARDYVNSASVYRFAGIVHVWHRDSARIALVAAQSYETFEENHYVLLWWDAGNEDMIDGCYLLGPTCNAQAIAQAGFSVHTESRQALQAMGLNKDDYPIWYRWHSQEELQHD